MTGLAPFSVCSASILCYPVTGHMGTVEVATEEVQTGPLRKHFFAERMTAHWNRLSREVIDALSL